MTRTARMALLAAFVAGAAMAADTSGAPTYVLSGYVFQGMPGVNTIELEAKLKHKKGARIERGDVGADAAIVARELKARHLKGRLLTALAEKHGRVWVIFDLQDLNRPIAHVGKPRYIESQKFEGAQHISAAALAAATGLKRGDALSPDKLSAARLAIIAAYAKSMPGKKLAIRVRINPAPGGKATLTWVIGEAK